MTADRLTPERVAEIAAAVTELDADRTLSFGTWTAGPVNEKSTLPPELAFVVEDVARLGSAVLRGSVGVFGDERHAAFTALARTAVSELLAELAAVRAERDQAQAELADYEPLNPQQCPAGKHADWLVDSEYAHACPWCRIAELEEDLRAVNAGWGVARAHIAKLERPAIEKQRNEIRDSYSELIAACNETKDYEGAFDVECRLRDREEQWKREDEEATR